ncbi:MAG: hypothetical protein CUN53_05015 [Phototrophicales bacterium]|nr:MAG: hypothetical protein CUN53_05015 [Phototrophicales bacterium]
MHKLRDARAFLILIGAFFTLMAAVSYLSAHTAAQTSGETRLDFFGVVQSANPNSISINGELIDTTRALINARLERGATIKVRAELRGGILTATRIDPVGAGFIPGITLLSGVMRGRGEQTIRVDEQVINVRTSAQIDNVRVGDPVSVLAVANAPGEWTALIVGAPNNPAFAPVRDSDVILPPVSTPEVILPPIGTPEVVLPPVSTPEVADDDDDHRGSDDNNRGSGDDDDDD